MKKPAQTQPTAQKKPETKNDEIKKDLGTEKK